MANLDQIPIVWRKSKKSASGDCIEVALSDESVIVRDSKDRGGPVLSFALPDWAAFLSGVRSGEFD
jgi:Domain of unknown function (DUF397)